MTSTADLANRTHALYRFYGAGGTLLYIGISVNLPTRLTEHRDGKDWWLGVTRITVEHYPDRASVLEAERRAIIAEHPLYNIQHNPIQGGSGPRQVLTRSSKLTAICMGCMQPIRGSNGVVHVRYGDVNERESAWRAFEEEKGEPWEPINLSALRALPDSARWAVHCDICNPHVDPDEPGTYCGGCYWFSVDRCASWAELVNWTAHLMGKNWLEHTNWDDFLRRISDGSPGAGFATAGGK